jgi:hypothetical protein
VSFVRETGNDTRKPPRIDVRCTLGRVSASAMGYRQELKHGRHLRDWLCGEVLLSMNQELGFLHR